VQFASSEQGFWESLMMSALQLTVIILAVRVRLYALTGQLLDARLTIRQIVAIRFSAEDEFPALAQRTAAENLTTDQIKRVVQDWQPVLHRV
jgi:hypothetical protein